MSAQLEWSRPAKTGEHKTYRSKATLDGGAVIAVIRSGLGWRVVVHGWSIDVHLPGADGATSWPTARRHALAEVAAILRMRLGAVKGAMP